MPRCSANLGFLWTDRPLPARIAVAAAAGFPAVECHFPYDHPPAEIRAALDAAGVPMVSLNTGLGANARDDFGVAARPGRSAEARALIDQAITYAAAVGCANVNVLAGATGRAPGCEEVFRDNVTYACTQAAAHGISILIEPLSPASAADYHCTNLDDTIATIEAVGAPNLKVLFDCFHIETMQGGAAGRLLGSLAHIGHIQIASVPDRAEPDHGTVDYPALFATLDRVGYAGWVGAEYHPAGRVEDGLGWLPVRSR